MRGLLSVAAAAFLPAALAVAVSTDAGYDWLFTSNAAPFHKCVDVPSLPSAVRGEYLIQGVCLRASCVSFWARGSRWRLSAGPWGFRVVVRDAI